MARGPWALAGPGWCVDPPGAAGAGVLPSVRRIGYACAHGPHATPGMAARVRGYAGARVPHATRREFVGPREKWAGRGQRGRACAETAAIAAVSAHALVGWRGRRGARGQRCLRGWRDQRGWRGARAQRGLRGWRGQWGWWGARAQRAGGSATPAGPRDLEWCGGRADEPRQDAVAGETYANGGPFAYVNGAPPSMSRRGPTWPRRTGAAGCPASWRSATVRPVWRQQLKSGCPAFCRPGLPGVPGSFLPEGRPP